MLTINIHEAKTHLSRFVEQAAAGEEIIIAKAGKPLARLVPLQSAPCTRTLGIFKGKLNTSADFDEALPEEILKLFEAGEIDPTTENR